MSRIKDLTGQKFGMLTVIRKTDKKRANHREYLYECKCDCGNVKHLTSSEVKRNKSCGCYRYKHEDIKNKKFGKLTAIELIGNSIWKCRCDCGKYVKVRRGSLISNSTKSCGCLKQEDAGESGRRAHADKNLIEKTNISMISRSEPIKSNTSGVTGVSFDKEKNKWVSNIRFKGKVYFLGRYTIKEDAIKARKEAEERLHKDFLRAKGLI